eukprot:scaffold586_cov209-Chaetoceros_neogracile.AAC.2
MIESSSSSTASSVLLATIQIRGLGHSLTIHHSPFIPISTLFDDIQSLTGLPPPYQRIIIRGKTLTYPDDEDDEDDGTHSKKSLDVQLPLNQIIPGIKEGSTSKGILMHSKSYKLDQNIVENITKLNHELDSIEQQIKGVTSTSPSGGKSKVTIAVAATAGPGKEMTRKAAQHLITDIMCQLDTINVGDSNTLRDMRRKVLHRAAAVEKLWGAPDQKEKDDER